MIIQTITVNNCTPQTIVIGRRGTYDTMQIAFDLSYLIENYGSGTAVLAVKRSQDTSAYPAVTAQEDNTLTWTVSETDTYYVGAGECELMWYVDGGLAKTIIYPMVVMRDILSTTEEAPDAYQTWVDDLTALGAETLQNAQDAAQSAADAEDAKDDAVAAKEAAEAALEEFTTPTASATTLAAGSQATAEYSDGNFAFGIPRGADGSPGTPGAPGADGVTPDFSIGTVTTLEPTQPATATITGTTENPVLNLGIPKGAKGDPGQGGGSVDSVNGQTGAVVLDAGDLEFDDSETYPAGSLGAEVSQQKNAISQIESEARIPENFFYSEGGTNNGFNAFGVIEAPISAGININTVEYTMGVSKIPQIAIINADTHELLFKESGDEVVATGEVARFDLHGITFNVASYVLIYGPKFQFVIGDYEYDKVKFDSVAPATINNASVGDVIVFENNPDATITYKARVEIYLTFANQTGNELKNLLIVAPKNAEFTKVSAAVEAAKNGDTVFVFPGVYEDEIIRVGSKKINIIGLDRDSVIIKNNTNARSTPALEMAKGTIKHVTILQDEDLSEPITNSYPYCIHTDSDNLTNETFIVEDCMLDCKFNAAIGIGLRNNCHMFIRNCIIKTEHNLNNANVHIGAVFVHPGNSGENQNIEISNCQMISKYGSALHVQYHYILEGAKAYVTVMQSFLWSDELGKASGIVSKQGTTQNIFITEKTFGNNVEISPV